MTGILLGFSLNGASIPNEGKDLDEEEGSSITCLALSMKECVVS